MSLTVFIAVLGAAFLHASWNALVKGGADKTLNLGAVILGHVPPALVAIPFVPLPATESLPYLFIGIGLHFGYQFFLINSYKIGDLTQVYPIARGSAPLIVSLVSVLFLGVTLESQEILAVLLIAGGIISLALVRRADQQRNGKAALLALVTGGFIASYSLVDGLGARVAGTSLGFFAWLAIGNAMVMALFLRTMAPGTLTKIALNARFLFLVGGAASFLAFAIVTWAFTQAPIALVTALREISIVFALFFGVFFLKEQLSLTKLLSTIATICGVILLRYAR
jgi:drug/metabolite transporter (DMT)-like permease